MRKLIVFLMLAVLGFSIYWFMFRKKEARAEEPKQAPIAVKKHTDQFNNAVEQLMGAYYQLKDAFVEGDIAAAKQHAAVFMERLDSIPLAELEKDDKMIAETAKATITDLKANSASLIKQNDLTEMRLDFKTISDLMYPAFFKIINYEGPALYLQNCPMAFDGDKDANWISNSNEVVNPYLGKNHPKFKATMLHCGEVKDSIVGTF